MARVAMHGLNKMYDEVHAVIDVNLHINDQEFAVRAADELHALIQHARDIHVTEEH